MILIVPRGHCVLLERFGRHVAVCRQGLHAYFPLITKAAAVLLAQKTLDGQDRITRNPAHRVFLTSGQPFVLRSDDALPLS